MRSTATVTPVANDKQARFAETEAVDFVIVGSGSAGGILARELSTKGFDVVVLEQGPWRTNADFNHDEIGVMFNGELRGGAAASASQTFRADESEVAQPSYQFPIADYARTVGGSSVHFSGNYWRFRDIDFNERSLLGPISGTTFADWPITYDELEPYYTRVEWEIGVSGAPGPFDSFRSKPYPVPPMPIKSSGAILERAGRKLGLHPQPAPVAILSQPHNGRAGCIHCGYCMGYGCEVGAKSSTLVSMIPQAVATGRCEIRPESTVFQLVTNARGRMDEVLYYDAAGAQRSQKAKAVILSANGAETARLLLESASAAHPDGLANGSGFVGRNLMFNGHALANGVFEEQLNDYKSIQVTRIIFDYYESDPARGFYGGGGIDARPLFSSTPVMFSLAGMPPDAPTWGAGFKEMLAHNYTRQMSILGNTTSLAMDRNNVTLDPTHRDLHGRPALRITYRDHDDDLATAAFFRDKAMELFDAAGATKSWSYPVEPQNGGAHLLGTCRMGDDPATSVVDRHHRSHEVQNLFICDGSSFVTSGRGQPTMTIMALAFRAAEHIAAAARANEV